MILKKNRTFIPETRNMLQSMRIRYLFTSYILLAISFIGYSQEQADMLPIIYIDTQGTAIGQDARTSAIITIVHSSQADSLLLPSHRIGIKVRGKTSAGYPKNPTLSSSSTQQI